MAASAGCSSYSEIFLRREAIDPAERFSATLRYLVTGDAQVTISLNYRMSPTIIGRILFETCQVICDVLSREGFMTAPNSETEWENVSHRYEILWNFKQCLGAIDGKHVVMQAPPRSGSDYFNYKKTYSLVLMAVCNADYLFTLVDIGDSGRQSDAGDFANSNLGFSIKNDLLNVPPPRNLPGSEKKSPYVFEGDDVFTLKPNIMKPFLGQTLTRSQRIFNYRPSSARRVIENYFRNNGITFQNLQKTYHC